MESNSVDIYDIPHDSCTTDCVSMQAVMWKLFQRQKNKTKNKQKKIIHAAC